MNLEEMERLQAANIRPLLPQVLAVLAPYQSIQLGVTPWYQVLQVLYSLMFPAAERSAMISRDYYDYKRAEAGLPAHLIPLQVPNFNRFVKDMEEVRPFLMSPTTSEHQIHQAAMRVARTVENSGRWTVMKATEYEDSAFPSDEPVPASSGKSRFVRGWARMATGAETCGWCWMLVSRGPVYRSAKSAGSTLGKRDALQTIGAQEFDTSEHMNAWHTGCDCKIVPVFDLQNWDGKDRQLAAEELWKQISRNESNNRDAINAYRRAVQDGRIQEILSESRAA